jgi:hypothetical protein
MREGRIRGAGGYFPPNARNTEAGINTTRRRKTSSQGRDWRMEK